MAASWAIRTLLTPGHAANHAAFALEGTGILFSGDHVMAWSTSIVAPPDGAMADYMASLDKLLTRRDRFFLPGHGGPVKQPRQIHARPEGAPQDARARHPGAAAAGRPHDPRDGRRRSTATPIRGCTARPRCRCWRIWRTSSREASSRPTAIRRSMRIFCSSE